MYDIADIASQLGLLRLEDPAPAAGDYMRVLAPFNQCMAGMIRFAGTTEWERHPDDEFLYVVEGQVEVTILAGGDTRRETLRPGLACVVPAGAWHKQRTPGGVTLIYITSAAGTDHSAAETP
ncbi:cupin domain-containing protein [Phenylobacterium sp.]|uniref:cupin domain-containing protein n=1 Tax=Phenylobacterium sp. TaxID=1871053 RepID=UPI00289EF50E|nr:cupin domain-containing protein [Phenylobacterium sp.]